MFKLFSELAQDWKNRRFSKKEDVRLIIKRCGLEFPESVEVKTMSAKLCHQIATNLAGG